MKLDRRLSARLEFITRVVRKEIGHLRYSSDKVFKTSFTLDRARQLETDQELAEQVEAFTSRFCRLQDTVGDKLIPAWLDALGEKTHVAVDNFDKAEKIGVLPSVDRWLELRQLRNQMIHEYIEDLAILSDALDAGGKNVDFIIGVAEAILRDLEERSFLSTS